MKQLTLIILLSINLLATQWHTFDEAKLIQNKNSNPNIIMIYVTASHCPYCKRMDKNVFQDKNMSKWLESKFIAVKIDMDFDDIPMNLKPTMTPTFYFVEKAEKVIKTIPGSWNQEDFKDLTRKIK